MRQDLYSEADDVARDRNLTAEVTRAQDLGSLATESPGVPRLSPTMGAA